MKPLTERGTEATLRCRRGGACRILQFPLLFIVILAALAAAAGLGNGFAYDDVHLVLRNERVHDIGRLPALFMESYWPPAPLGPDGRLYRPLTTAAFTVQWALGGGSPLLFHIVSAGLYVLVSLLVLALATRILPLGPATAAAALFAAHPIHTEVVGNVVGQGELLAAGWALLALILALDGERAGWSVRRSAGVLGAFTAALLSKEHSVVVVLLFPILVLARGGTRALLRESTGRALILMAGVLVLYLSLRHAILGGISGDLMHAAWRDETTVARWLTMLAAVPTIVRLYLWPSHLQADYSPRELLVEYTLTGPALLGLGLVLGLCALAFVARRQPAIVAGLAWVTVAFLPAANLLLPTGVILAERTLFLPSVGLCLIAGGVAGWIGRRFAPQAGARLTLGALVLGLVVIGTIRSAMRLPDWRDNQTLFSRTLRDAPESYWAWRTYAGDLVLRDEPDSARAAYQRSLALFDRDPNVLDDFAGLERRQGRCDRSVPLLRQALQLDPSRDLTAARLVGCYVTLGAFDSARAEARHRLQSGREEFRSLLGMVDSAERVRQLTSPLSP